MITEFTGEHSWLSNFWPAEVSLSPDGEVEVFFPTVEHAYQAVKATSLGVFLQATGLSLEEYCQRTPGQAKRIGKAVSLRPDWEDIKVEVMRRLLRQKFAPGTKLWQKLLDTGDVLLVEGNTWHDRFWGVCQCSKHLGEGQNVLGVLLMEIRQELAQEMRG